LKLASKTGCGIGNNSDFPVVNPVANLDIAVVLIAELIHTTLVVPAGVAVGAGVYNELLHMDLSSPLVVVK
jgi:hypothetical protein